MMPFAQVLSKTTVDRAAASSNILVINGHPDPRPERFCAALCAAYVAGARASGTAARLLSVGALPALGPGADLSKASEALSWATHLELVFPLWLDRAPMQLRRFLEQLGRADVLANTSASAIVTMEMPALFQRSPGRSGADDHAERLGLPGIVIGNPVFIGSVNVISDACRKDWLSRTHARGRGD
ncbi:MAG TPA: NAD(P)H-dependent oxidoreductase [Rhizomicrobium sp.]|nr:NAD(P)H-dependent oxidoreductase [Rhizomicrobium sp.]